MSDAAESGVTLSARERVLVPLAAAAYVALAFLTEPSLFRATDFVKDWIPNRTYLQTRLLAGELPLWNPYVALGRPFLASIDTSAFYPSTLLNLLVGLHVGVVVSTMVHFALAAVSMILLAGSMGATRPARWLAAAAFLGSGHVFLIVHVGSAQYGWGACYAPLVFLLGARLQDRFSARRVAALALALTLQLLTGWPQIAWITWLGLGAFQAGRSLGSGGGLRALASGVGGQALALGWAFLLAAVQLGPLFELVRQSNRAAPTVEGAAAAAMTAKTWLSFAVPPGPVSQIHLLAASFVGVPVVLAGLCGLARLEDRNVRGLLAASALAALVASGLGTPAFRLLFHLVPGLSSFHFHGRTSIVVMMALALGGALFLSAPGVWRRSLLVLAVAAAALLAATAWWYQAVVAPAAPAPLWLAGRCAVIAASALLLAAWHLRRPPAARPWALAGVAALALVEMGAAMATIKRYGAFPRPFQGEAVVVQTLRQEGLFGAEGVPPRVFVPYPLIRDNSGEMYGYSTVSGYVTLALDRTWTCLHETLRVPFPEGANEYPNPAIYDFGPFAYSSMNLALGWDPRSGALRINGQPDPRAYVAGAAQPVPDWRAAIRLMRDGHDFHSVALLEGPAPGPLDGGGGSARIVHFAPERLVVDASSEGRALLLLAEPWYPGWSARVNGSEAPVLPANAWMRAVPLPAGRSEVVLQFRSRFLLAGAVVSVLSLAALAAALLTGRRRAVP